MNEREALEDYGNCHRDVQLLQSEIQKEKERESADFPGDNRSLHVIYEEYNKKMKELELRLAVAQEKEKLAAQQLEQAKHAAEQEHQHKLQQALEQERGRCHDNPSLDKVLAERISVQRELEQREAYLRWRADAEKSAMMNQFSREKESGSEHSR